MSKTDLAFWLAIYASAIASATGLWSLFRELWLERARLSITPLESWLVATTRATSLIVRGKDTLQTMGVPVGARKPVLQLIIRPRGRRDAHILSISQVSPEGKQTVFGDLLEHLPLEIPAEQTKTLLIGHEGGYEHGDIRLGRFFVVDGASRVHPLRERYRQRLSRGPKASEEDSLP